MRTGAPLLATSACPARRWRFGFAAPREVRDATRHRHEFARHHHDRHGVLLGPDLGDHLHAPQLKPRGILHDDLRRAAQLLGRFELGLGLDEAGPLLAQRLGLLRDRALHRFRDLAWYRPNRNTTARWYWSAMRSPKMM